MTIRGAAELVDRLQAQILQLSADLERLARSKSEPALKAAKGDRKAAAELAALNAKIATGEAAVADLRLALEGARAELAEAEQAQKRVADGELADLIDQRLAELIASRLEVDTAMARLTSALRRHHDTAWSLRTAIPRSQEPLTYGLGEPLVIRLALEHHGLAAVLGLPMGTSGAALASHATTHISSFAAALRRALPQAA